MESSSETHPSDNSKHPSEKKVRNDELLPPLEIKERQKQELQHQQSHPNSTQRTFQQIQSPVPSPRMINHYQQSAITVEELKELVPILIYTLIGLATRLYKIGRANTVIWDEAHFGKFGAYYLNQTFYFDVHPPLAKMMVGVAGLLSGFDGSYDFPSGQVYPSHVPYTGMRILLALPGVALIPIAWATALELGFSLYTRHIVTMMVLSDAALTVISRFILLDSMLLFFTFTTVYCLVCFHNQRRYAFDFEWWFWLSMTGLSIGCVTSVKWIGLFVTALVGAYTAEELWEKFGDLRMPIRVYLHHWIARIVCLIVLPILVYMFFFKIHFMILNRSGPGDAQMSSLFQANLIGNDFARNPLEVAVGSRVTIKNMGFGGGLLHSHVQTYPVGSQQQQITCYHYRDDNNAWFITPLIHEPEYNDTQPLKFIKHGSVIRLVHALTGRNLHTHQIPAPVSKLNNEVAGYGNSTLDDSNSYWIVEVVDDIIRGKRKNFEKINVLSTRFRLRSLNLGCYLIAENKVLPQWGFKQVEVSCDKQNNPKNRHTYWNVEGHFNPRLPPGNMKLMKSPFLNDFWHLNIAMMTSNNALIPDPDKNDAIASHPFDWPFIYSGMRMNAWLDNGIKFYLVGNPMVWWMSSVGVLSYLVLLVWYSAKFKRKVQVDLTVREWNSFVFVGKVGVGGWMLHYLPFLFMGRVTYLHHYLSSLWFSIITFGLMIDHLIFKTRRLNSSQPPSSVDIGSNQKTPTNISNDYYGYYYRMVNDDGHGGKSDKDRERESEIRRRKVRVFLVLSLLVLVTGWYFKECAWGIVGAISKYRGRQWRKSWDIYEDHTSN